MNTRPRYRFHRQAGVGLVEIMVAVTLSLILTAGLVHVYTGNKQTYRIQEALSRVQENGRFALDFITRDLRSAGFLGCAGTSTKTTNTLNNASTFNWNFDQIIEGFEATGSSWDRDPVATAGIVSPYLPARDVLTIRRSLGNPVQVAAYPGGNPTGSADIKVDPPHGLERFDVVMVTDCTDAAIFQITNINTSGASQNIVHNTGGASTPGNATKALGKDYTGAGEIVQLMTSTYYIGTGASGRPALFRKDGAAAAQELVEGVEDMQVLYGIDTDSNRTANRYVTANNVADWGDVVSAEVRLLLQTLDNNLTPQAQPYTFNGVNTLPADLRLRRVFTNTISIRNRTL